MLSKTQMRVYSNKLTRKFPELQNVTILAIVQLYQSDRLQSRQDFLDSKYGDQGQDLKRHKVNYFVVKLRLIIYQKSSWLNVGNWIINNFLSQKTS